jgi:predicted dinucleotide-binding enzyme
MTHSRIGIIGANDMCRARATRFAAARHDVTVAATHQARTTEAATAAGHAARGVPATDIAVADVVIRAVPYRAVAAALAEAGDARAKIVVAARVNSACFDAVDSLPLASAWLLEPLGLLDIYLGDTAGRGMTISPAVVAAS